MTLREKKIASSPNSPAMISKNNNLTISERQIICSTWERASSTTDIGCELVARLLNDNRTKFRALLECKSGSLLSSESYTREDVNKMPRARAVGDGVNRFFNKAISKLMDENYLEEIRELSLQLGAMHFRMKVWFQAENWLCVKNCLLDSVVSALVKDTKGWPISAIIKKIGETFSASYIICGGSKKIHVVEKSVTQAWFKFVQFVIQNMKKGFLTEALNSDSSKTDCSSPVLSGSSHSV